MLLVQYDASVGVDELQISARDKTTRVAPRARIEIDVPAAWAGDAVEVVVEGLRQGQLVVRGVATATPVSDEVVAVTVTLAAIVCQTCTEGARQCQGGDVMACQVDAAGCTGWQVLGTCDGRCEQGACYQSEACAASKQSFGNVFPFWVNGMSVLGARRRADASGELVNYDLATGEVEVLVDGIPSIEFAERDGSKVVWIGTHATQADAALSLWFADLAGGVPRRLHDVKKVVQLMEYTGGAAYWYGEAADGRKGMFRTDVSTATLHLLLADGDDEELISDGGSDPTGISWLVHKHNQVFRLDGLGGQRVLIASAKPGQTVERVARITDGELLMQVKKGNELWLQRYDITRGVVLAERQSRAAASTVRLRRGFHFYLEKTRRELWVEQFDPQTLELGIQTRLAVVPEGFGYWMSNTNDLWFGSNNENYAMWTVPAACWQ